MYTFEDLKNDVAAEAKALREHATKEELAELNLSEFDPNAAEGCIYGQMTGDCYSDRAALLVSLCTQRYFRHEMFDVIEKHGVKGLSKAVNGKSVADFIEERAKAHLYMNTKKVHYSAIEAYILLPEAKNANLIAYLKGETENLEL